MTYLPKIFKHTISMTVSGMYNETEAGAKVLCGMPPNSNIKFVSMQYSHMFAGVDSGGATINNFDIKLDGVSILEYLGTMRPGAMMGRYRTSNALLNTVWSTGNQPWLELEVLGVPDTRLARGFQIEVDYIEYI